MAYPKSADSMLNGWGGMYGVDVFSDTDVIDDATSGLAKIAQDVAAILVDTGVIGALGAGLTGIPWNAAWDAEVQSEVVDALTAEGYSSTRAGYLDELAAANLPTDVAAIAAYVDTEVAAIISLLDDARSEPGQGAPPVNPDLATKIDYLYKRFRNKKDQDNSTFQLYADDGTTVDQKATISDVGGLGTFGEMVGGP